MSKIKILVVPSDHSGVGHFRSTNPHLQLEKQYPDEFHVDIDYNPNLKDMGWLKSYDIIHYHKTLGNVDNMEVIINELTNAGVVTIMDIDDYWLPTMKHPTHYTYKFNGYDKQIINSLRLAKNITTTTDLFADEIKKINKNVVVIPNSIDAKESQYKIVETKSDRLRIGWLGGSSHYCDLVILQDLVNKLNSEGLIDKVQFVICGFDVTGSISEFDPITKEEISNREITPEESIWYEYEKIFTDNYKVISPAYKKHLLNFNKKEFNGVENEPYRRVWTKPVNTYASNYNLFDISIAPLDDNIFNKVKSQLKVIEAGVFKKPIIAQDFGPYKIDLKSAFKKGGEIDLTGNSFLVDKNKNSKDWLKFIKKFIDKPELIKIIGDNLHKTVTEMYNIELVTKSRRNYYNELVNKQKNA